MNSDLPKCVPPVVMDTNAWLSDLHFFSNGYNMFQLLIGAGIGLWETHPSVSSPKCQPVGNFCAFGSASLSQLEVSLCPGRVRTVAQKAPGPSQPASLGGKAMDCRGWGCLLPTASCGLSSCQSGLHLCSLFLNNKDFRNFCMDIPGLCQPCSFLVIPLGSRLPWALPLSSDPQNHVLPCPWPQKRLSPSLPISSPRFLPPHPTLTESCFPWTGKKSLSKMLMESCYDFSSVSLVVWPWC